MMWLNNASLGRAEKMGRTGTPTLLLVSMLVTGFVAAGCGTATGQRSEAGTDSDIAAIEVHADEIYTKIGGDAGEREAAHYLTVAAINKDLIACMEQADFEVASLFHPIWTDWEPDSTEGQ